MAGLTSMANIGREMEKKLAAVGIDSPEKLRELGAEQAFARLKRDIPVFAWCIFTVWRGQ